MKNVKEIKQSGIFKRLMLASRKIDGCISYEPKKDICSACDSREKRVINAIKELLKK